MRAVATKADLTEKDIPSDKEILEIWESISDPRWKWVHGMVAAFGIRPSESRETSFKGNRIDLMTYKTKAIHIRVKLGPCQRTG